MTIRSQEEYIALLKQYDHVDKDVPVRFDWSGFPRERTRYRRACERLRDAFAACPEHLHDHLLDAYNRDDIYNNPDSIRLRLQARDTPEEYVELEMASQDLALLEREISQRTGIHYLVFYSMKSSIQQGRRGEIIEANLAEEAAKYTRMGHSRYLRTISSGRRYSDR